MTRKRLTDGDYADLMPYDDGSPPVRHGPSIIRPETMGLDPRHHQPVDPPQQKKRVGPVRYRLWTDKAALGEVMAVGWLMRDAAVHLITNPEHALVHDRPHTLTYYHVDASGLIERLEHVPAFGVRFVDGSVAFVDAKRDDEIDGAWLRREAQLKQAYHEDHGVHYTCLRESVVRVEPLLPNLKRIRRLADAGDRRAITAIRQSLETLGLPTTLGALRGSISLITKYEDAPFGDMYDRGLSAVMALVLSGELRLDLSREIDDGTRVFEGIAAPSGPDREGGR
jgi:hypothetical protein